MQSLNPKKVAGKGKTITKNIVQKEAAGKDGKAGPTEPKKVPKKVGASKSVISDKPEEAEPSRPRKVVKKAGSKKSVVPDKLDDAPAPEKILKHSEDSQGEGVGPSEPKKLKKKKKEKSQE